MVRILHLADLHLGVDRYGSINPETGLSLQVEDFIRALDEAVDYAVDWEADLFLFCGDAYKSRDPSQTQQREFARRIARLVGHNIQVFLLVGNHDLPHARGLANSLEIFHTLNVGNVTVAGVAGTYRVSTRDGVVQVVAMPWTTRSALLTKEDFRSSTIDDLNRVIEQKLSHIVEAEAASLDKSLPAIFAGHLTHSLATYGSEKGLHLGQDYVLPVSVLSNPAFDYVALGHIHKTQKVESPVPVVYAGSLQRIDFSEEGQDKGFYAVELNSAKPGGERLLSYNFVAVKARNFLTIEVKIDTADSDPTATVLRQISRQEEAVKDAIVRVKVILPAEIPGDVQEAEVRRALKEARHIAAISKEIGSRPRPRLSGLSPEGLAPMKALQEYLKVTNTSPDRQKVLLEYARKLVTQYSDEPV